MFKGLVKYVVVFALIELLILYFAGTYFESTPFGDLHVVVEATLSIFVSIVFFMYPSLFRTQSTVSKFYPTGSTMASLLFVFSAIYVSLILLMAIPLLIILKLTTNEFSFSIEPYIILSAIISAIVVGRHCANRYGCIPKKDFLWEFGLYSLLIVMLSFIWKFNTNCESDLLVCTLFEFTLFEFTLFEGSPYVGSPFTVPFFTLLLFGFISRYGFGLGARYQLKKYWETKSSELTMILVNILLKLIKKIDSNLTLKYNRDNIGIERNGLAYNFVLITPRKEHLTLELRIPQIDEVDEIIDNNHLEISKFVEKLNNKEKNIREKTPGYYKLKLTREELLEKSDIIFKLAEITYIEYEEKRHILRF